MSEPVTVAALYVERGGVYWDLPGVDPWDAERDARLYAGPHPVVAHPPCERWGRFATVNGQVEGDDGGRFASAVSAVRRWGGVLEHPAESRAFAAFYIPRPTRGAGWQRACDPHESWVCCVDQGNYGHRAAKPTWLYAVGTALPSLAWGPAVCAPVPERSRVSALARGVRPSRVGTVAIMSRSQRRATPPAFRDLLLSIARSVRPREVAA